MATSYYKGIDTYVIYAEDSAFGTPGTPSGSSYVDKVSTFTANITNNMILVHGIGEGRNATHVVNGNLDVTGSMEWELTDPDFLQYCFVGTRAGSGTAADPYEVQEANEIGYGAGQVNTLTLEVGSEGGANDDVMTYDGVVINTFTLSVAQGETAKCSAEWIGRSGTSSTTVETYTAPTDRPFTFIDGSMTVGTDTVGSLMSAEITCENNMFLFRTMGNRVIAQPVAGVRRYNFTLTLKLYYDDTASTLSGLEARGIVFDGTPSGTTPTNTAQNTSVAVSLDLVEGAGSGDRVVNFDFEECYFESYSAPVELEQGAIEITITGYALAGLTDGSAKVPVRWWTIT